jgi:hypothetical protein
LADQAGRDVGRAARGGLNGINAPQRPDCVVEVPVLCERVSVWPVNFWEQGFFAK